MVIEDLNQDQSRNQSSSQAFYPADPVERIFSFLLDVAFLSPLITLACAFHFQEILKDEAQNFQSQLWISMILTGVFTSVSLQALFIYFFNATPGQAFLNLRVQSLESTRITWGASFLRSILFHVSFVFFFVPFIESFTHRLGQCLHDRASDTMVVQSAPPRFYYFSRKAIKNLKSITFVLLFFVCLFVLNALTADFYLPTTDISKQRIPVDQLVSKAILLKEFDSKKNIEMSERLWTSKNEKERSLIYYYQFVFEKDESQKKLISQKVCQKNINLICELMQLSLVENKKLTPKDWNLDKMSLTEKVGLMRQAALVSNFKLAFQVHDSLSKNSSIKQELKIWDVALYIQANQNSQTNREPASQSLELEALSHYKESRGNL